MQELHRAGGLARPPPFARGDHACDEVHVRCAACHRTPLRASSRTLVAASTFFAPRRSAATPFRRLSAPVAPLPPVFAHPTAAHASGTTELSVPWGGSPQRHFFWRSGAQMSAYGCSEHFARSAIMACLVAPQFGIETAHLGDAAVVSSVDRYRSWLRPAACRPLMLVGRCRRRQVGCWRLSSILSWLCCHRISGVVGHARRTHSSARLRRVIGFATRTGNRLFLLVCFV